jgi:hypothetical protein
MKTILHKLLLILVLELCAVYAWSQAEAPGNNSIPLNAPNSLLYGDDILIDDQIDQDQQETGLAVAFNGWIYVSHVVNNTATRSWDVHMSMDDGLTWTTIISQSITAGWATTALDIIVCGTSTSDLKLFVARVYTTDAATFYEVKLSSYDANTGGPLATIYDNFSSTQKFMDVAIASDYLFPAYASTQYTIGLAYTATTPDADSVKFISFDAAGATPQTLYTVYSGSAYTRNVAIAYGRSSYYNYGRYHVAWEQRASPSADLGQIWTAHCLDQYNSSFTPPIRLENLIGGSADYCRNPVIACQFNDLNNYMGGYSEVVLFDRAFDGSTSDFDIVGTYNVEAANTDNWSIFGMYASFTLNDYHSDINFDPGYNNFLVTYFSSNETKLRYVVEHMDLPDPYNWTVISDKYNFENDLVNPYPKVEINPGYLQVAHVWTCERAGGYGETMFDAEYSVVGVQQDYPGDLGISGIYPNPAIDKVKMELNLNRADHIRITCNDATGRNGKLIFEGNVPGGRSVISADVSAIPAGLYIYSVQSSVSTVSGRLAIVR